VLQLMMDSLRYWVQEMHVVAVYLDGHGLTARDAWGERIVDDSFYVAINGFHEDVTFTIPPKLGRWERVLDTGHGVTAIEPHEGPLPVAARSLTVLRRRNG